MKTNMAKLLIESEEKLNFKKIAKAVYKTLGQKDKLKAEIVFMSGEEIRELNARERKIDKVTDVLSFPSLDGIRGKVLDKSEYPMLIENGRLFIGSIALCKEKIREQAQEFGHSEERETTYLTVHGLCHLFGYDHEDEQDKKEMREKEKQALLLLKIKD